MRKRCFVVALVAILFACVPAMAQGSGFGMGFKGGYIDIGGGDLSAVQGGFGLDLDLRYTWGNGVSIGFGTELAWPGSDLGEVIEPSLADFQFITVFFEPRYNFLFQRSRVSPFIGARVSYARMNFNVFTPPDETPFKSDSDGVEYGATVGVEFWLTDGVALSIAGEASGLSFGDVKVPEPRLELPDRLGKGRKLGILLGIEFLFL
jgi:opacity protein-like surface antigen